VSLPEIRVSVPGSLSPIDVTARAIRGAKQSIWAVVYKFDKPRILKALRAIMQDGVAVRLLVDDWLLRADKAKRQRPLVVQAAEFGAEVRTWNAGKLHAKFMIVDGERVLTGSYNWTRSAHRKNTELLMTFRQPSVADLFARRFRSLWRVATRYDP
jgi:phosphatidylserine/phosphatidylglycerophosphate/cardiolipin synthase-like enzyme